MNPQTPALSDTLPAAGGPDGELEGLLGRVEAALAGLGDALRLRDSRAIESHAQQLHQALEGAIHGFHSAARRGGVPSALRTRLVKASGQVAAQRESLVRATVALDRAIDVMMPRDTPALYGSRGWVGAGASSTYQA